MLTSSISQPKSKSMAKESIRKYFSSKNAFEERLLEDKYVDLCMSTDVCSGMKIVYEAMKNSRIFDQKEGEICPIEKDVKFVIKTLEFMSKHVPQEFSTGMLLMHLEVIEKIKFDFDQQG